MNMDYHVKRSWHRLQRKVAFWRSKFTLLIDTLGAGGCNLKCPSCPVGNSSHVGGSKGLLSVDLLDRIMKKAVGECRVRFVFLFNWTEPLLHPQLPELLRTVHRYGVGVGLSSNLNVQRRFDDILRENPETFRISLSGFRQESYAVTHQGGDIERVKRNMVELASAKRRTGAHTRIDVLYHRYSHNRVEEDEAREFCRELGFEFIPVWAYFMPLEKVLSFAEHPDHEQAEAITDEDRAILQRIALKPQEALLAAKRYRDNECELLHQQLTLDFQGNVLLCCGVYDRAKYSVGSFLDQSLATIQTRRQQHDMCRRCASQGGHVLATYGAPEFDSIADRNRRSYEARQATTKAA